MGNIMPADMKGQLKVIMMYAGYEKLRMPPLYLQMRNRPGTAKGWPKVISLWE